MDSESSVRLPAPQRSKKISLSLSVCSPLEWDSNIHFLGLQIRLSETMKLCVQIPCSGSMHCFRNHDDAKKSYQDKLVGEDNDVNV